MRRAIRQAAILFDIDGTLVDSTAVVERIWRERADRYDADPVEVLRICHGRRTVDTLRTFVPADQLRSAAADFEAMELAELDATVALPGAAAPRLNFRRSGGRPLRAAANN